MIPELGGSRQVRILLNTFFIRPRIKEMSSLGLMMVAFCWPGQHLLSFYELSKRLAERKMALRDLLVLSSYLFDVRETKKIRRTYSLVRREIKRQVIEVPLQSICEAIKDADRWAALYSRIYSDLEECLAERDDGPVAAQLLAKSSIRIDVTRVKRLFDIFHQT